ncbi:hypothetical protein BCE75_110163 [Isoptericola sp. CG 20/1183]|uniref:DUF1269 domain-containing protein n=1 Tax=Isoptericola halotolerans TaxID=300560 RepID=A0ABX5EAR0_9MICO|nr:MULTISPECIES: DUF6325 family protein [Isoptericola]PRZ04357.1 hypothetical protein BCL65_11018 [Isoptericola halotolerans]PRZ04745.1 hypothetical protein BCE75_110163 [Isoptericola sp. CG 20/1183]
MKVTAPVELLLVEFPHSEFKGEIVAELVRLSEAGTINVLDMLAIRKNEDGSVEWLEAADAASELAELVGEPSGLLAEDDVEAIADDLTPGAAVGMLVFEHTWATGLTSALREAGGSLIDMTTVPPAAIEELAAVIAEED